MRFYRGEAHQIPVTDLLVGIQDEKIILRSRRLNKEVIPRMTSAHNYSMSTLPVYHFLCDLQYQHVRHIGWQWGPLESRPFLPRVIYGKYIFARARWLLTKEEIKECSKKKDEELIPVFSALIKKRQLPDYVLLSQGDNELMLHLQNIFCIKLLLAEVNKNDTVQLMETLDMPGQCWIESPDGHHAGEFIVAFNRKEKAEPKTGINNFPVKSQEIQRYFPVGSEWLYVKIYCGTKTAERILCEVIKPLTSRLLTENLIDAFFFIRYHDQDKHLRIRFHHPYNKNFWKEVIDAARLALDPFISDQTVHNLQFETYQREVERYGSQTMELSEKIFIFSPYLYSVLYPCWKATKVNNTAGWWH